MTRRIDKPDLEQGFRSQFATTDPQAQTRPIVLASDMAFELPSRALFDKAYAFVKASIPHEETYAGIDHFDCDDFSYIFKGLLSKWYQENRPHDYPLAVGICWGLFPGFGQDLVHSMNWVILDDGVLHWIEPQFVLSRDPSEAMRQSNKARDRLNLAMV
ncbi:lectin MOA-related protein [uncultured Tateyamaria sp.]|uniref:lectin MOA-related protein n=1 Tax=uncultured Tateyamaria sp. TaxID=455651 RepID=UPI00261D410E|nr:lectin MOA-related protein [uncultured Tateyamaria sp.]